MKMPNIGAKPTHPTFDTAMKGGGARGAHPGNPGGIQGNYPSSRQSGPMQQIAPTAQQALQLIFGQVDQSTTAPTLSAGGNSGAAPMKMEQDLATRPSANSERPENDKRSADEIINDNPILKNLGHQKDINRDTLYKVFGDWTANNKDESSRADAAYKASKYLNYIDNLNASNGGSRGDVAGNGDLEGITKDGDARSGTPAGHLADSWRAYESKMKETGNKDEALAAFYDAVPDNGKLRGPNNDRDKNYVFADGTNKSEIKGIMTTVGNALWFLPGVSNVLNGMGNAKGGFGETLLGGFEGVVDTWKGAAEGLLNAFKGGRMNPASMLVGMYTGALGRTEAAPQEVKDITKYV